jgi:16S rRNA processing protein RimM
LKEEITYLRIGKVIGTHGLDGRVKVLNITDIDGRFQAGKQVYLLLNGFYALHTIQSCEGQGKHYILLTFEHIDTKDAADKLCNSEIYIGRAEAEELQKLLDEDTFYYYEVIGAEVFYQDQQFGNIIDIITGGSSDILVVLDAHSKEYMIPFVASMVDTTRIAEGRIDITPVDGLLE